MRGVFGRLTSPADVRTCRFDDMLGLAFVAVVLDPGIIDMLAFAPAIAMSAVRARRACFEGVFGLV